MRFVPAQSLVPGMILARSIISRKQAFMLAKGTQLTAKYVNYLQVVADYEMYILNEAFGLPRLNKIAREIVFRYCTLSKKFRKSLASNPQFQPLLERWGVTQGAKAHGIDLFVKKVKK